MRNASRDIIGRINEAFSQHDEIDAGKAPCNDPHARNIEKGGSALESVSFL